MNKQQKKRYAELKRKRDKMLKEGKSLPFLAYPGYLELSRYGGNFAHQIGKVTDVFSSMKELEGDELTGVEYIFEAPYRTRWIFADGIQFLCVVDDDNEMRFNIDFPSKFNQKAIRSDITTRLQHFREFCAAKYEGNAGIGRQSKYIGYAKRVREGEDINQVAEDAESKLSVTFEAAFKGIVRQLKKT